MIVFGYTRDRKVEPVDFSPQEIAKAGIHAWALDLFDPDPVIQKINGTRLFFSRVSNVSFAYMYEPGTMVVALHNGQPACLLGTIHTHNKQTVQLTNLRSSSETFEQHYSRFLASRETQTAEDDWLLGSSTSAPPQAFVPGVASNVSMQAGRLRFDTGNTPYSIGRVVFIGRTLEELLLLQDIPPSIVWALRQFVRWHAVAVGQTVRYVVQGMAPSLVQMVVTPHSLTDIEPMLKTDSWITDLSVRGRSSMITAASWKVIEFTRAGCRYELHESASPQQWLGDELELSPNWMYCSKPDQVIATRLALSDLGRKQAREPYLVSGHRMYTMEEEEKPSRQALLEEGFQLLTFNQVVPTNTMFATAAELARRFHIPESGEFYSLRGYSTDETPIVANPKTKRQREKADREAKRTKLNFAMAATISRIRNYTRVITQKETNTRFPNGSVHGYRQFEKKKAVRNRLSGNRRAYTKGGRKVGRQGDYR